MASILGVELVLEAAEGGLLELSDDAVGVSAGANVERAAIAAASPDMTFWTAVWERFVTALWPWAFFWTLLGTGNDGVDG